ncbi:MAG TPA: hypothetical protein VMM37_09820, partial [Bacteroidota bacterium]|nr:hypothetical protein [Bacteroidota bacterium]
ASLHSQITVQQSDFLKIFYPGDTLDVLVLQDTAVNVGRTGGPNVYDFSPLTLVSGGKIPVLLGRKFATLAHEQLAAGTYQRTFDATMLGSGVYFCRLSAEKYSVTKKLVLLR